MTASAIRGAIAGLALAVTAGLRAQTVEVEDGAVRGKLSGAAKIAVFKGIPYAAPPVGPRRWRPPTDAARWTGTLAADHFAPDCFSARPSTESTASGQSEDCLYLNIWTPSLAARKLPVMVWIYGGAFAQGSPAVPRFDGEGLAGLGVILVTFSYRTGVFGYLSHPGLTAESRHHASGNYGVLDAMAALRWVRRNIAAFGGDPANVTLFGQSSGSQTVNLLTVSPLARGLFAKVIGESGAGFGEREPMLQSGSERDGADYAAGLGGSIAALRARTPQDLVAAIGERKFEPIVDGWVLPADPHDIYAEGRANDVPTLLGSNADESQLSRTMTLAEYAARITKRYGIHAAEVLAAFPATDDDTARTAAKAQGTVVLGDYNIASWADWQRRSGRAPVWQYRFEHVPPPSLSPPFPAGAYHGAEILYAFHNLHMQPRAWTDADRSLEAMLSSYWTNFARTGDPNGPGLPRWDALDPRAPQVLAIDASAAMAPRPNTGLIGTFDRIFYAPGGVYRLQTSGEPR